MINPLEAEHLFFLLNAFQKKEFEHMEVLRFKLSSFHSAANFKKIVDVGRELQFLSTDGDVARCHYHPEHETLFYRFYIKQNIKILGLESIYQSHMNKVTHGRKIFCKAVEGTSLHQLLRYADLIDGLDSNIVCWWDDFSASHRKEDDSRKLLTGRKGEELSLKYEKIIINHLAIEHEIEIKTPIWEAVDNNDSGYDIGSFTVFENKWCDKKVEVKSSESDYGIFSFSRNQYKTMRTFNKTYEVHLWKLKTQELAVLTYEDLSPHMPLDQGKGSWSAVDIHFSEFKHKFFVPDLTE